MRQEVGKGGELEGKVSGDYLRLLPGLYLEDESVGKFKMVAGDVISIRGQVLEYTYIPTGIEWELVRFGMDGGTVGRRPVAIHSS